MNIQFNFEKEANVFSLKTKVQIKTKRTYFKNNKTVFNMNNYNNNNTQ